MDNIKEIQYQLLIMLEEIDQFCRLHNIKYTLEGGTALGAYRHQGFIPWDDDVDIAMDIKEYKKFCALMEKEPPKHLRIQTHKTESLYFNGFAKIRDTRTEFEEQRVKVKYKDNGCFIDVFPLECAFPVLIGLFHLLYRPLIGLSHIELHKKTILQRIAVVYYYFCMLIASFFRLISKLFNSKSYSYSYGCNLYTFKWNYRKEMFNDLKWLKFENNFFPAPGKIEDYLKIHYGKDYMVLPPEEKRISHHLVSMKFKDNIV